MASRANEELSYTSGRPTGKAPVGFSAASARSEYIKNNTSDRAAIEDAAGEGMEPQLPWELQQHSFAKICVKGDARGTDGPWFCYAYVDKKR
mmetsp:Transcript_125783/g.350476  ORF Transcript_125783/g.350476 Transcript_125783/m.350476 type:complete len:92 (-) Transcript_125783:119-394(-)